MSQDLALLGLSIENERARMINVAKIDFFAEKRLEKLKYQGILLITAVVNM